MNILSTSKVIIYVFKYALILANLDKKSSLFIYSFNRKWKLLCVFPRSFLVTQVLSGKYLQADTKCQHTPCYVDESHYLRGLKLPRKTSSTKLHQLCY